MPHTINAESDESDRLKKAFIPSKQEITALLTGSFFVLLILNSFPAIKQINNASYVLITEFIREAIEKIVAPTNNQQGSKILTVVFWMVVGMFVYVIIYVIANIISNYRNDVVNTGGMILPANSKKEKVWHETILRIIVRVLATVMFFYWLYLLLAGILPNASTMFLNAFTELTVISVLQATSAVVILALSVFVAMLFARCIVLRERVFGS